MIAVLLAQSIVAQPLPIPADVANARWEFAAAQGGGQLFLDPDSIAHAGDIVRFRIRIFAANPGPGFARSMAVDTEFDCARRTATVYSERTFLADGGQLDARVCGAALAGTERGPGQ